jgi:hypothetical protein
MTPDRPEPMTRLEFEDLQRRIAAAQRRAAEERKRREADDDAWFDAPRPTKGTSS